VDTPPPPSRAGPRLARARSPSSSTLRRSRVIEVNCEPTSSLARTSSSALVRDLAIQVAGLRPIWPTVESIPAVELEAKRSQLLADEATQKKPEAVRGQIIEGQLKKWFAEVVLVEQPFRDQDRTVGELITEAIAKTGENMKVRRFVRFELGRKM